MVFDKFVFHVNSKLDLNLKNIVIPDLAIAQSSRHANGNLYFKHDVPGQGRGLVGLKWQIYRDVIIEWSLLIITSRYHFYYHCC